MERLVLADFLADHCRLTLLQALFDLTDNISELVLNDVMLMFFSSALMASSLCNGTDGMDAECIVCSDAHAEVVFRPCGHRIVCVPCSVRMKKCIQCRTVISSKVGPG